MQQKTAILSFRKGLSLSVSHSGSGKKQISKGNQYGSINVVINGGNEQGEGGEGLEMGRARLPPRECDPVSNVMDCPDDYTCMCESDTCTCTKKLRAGEECDPKNPHEKCPEEFPCMCSWGCTCGGEWVPPPTNATNEVRLQMYLSNDNMHMYKNNKFKSEFIVTYELSDYVWQTLSYQI